MTKKGKTVLITAALFCGGALSARAELSGKWSIAGRMCAKAGRYEPVAGDSVLWFSRGRYSFGWTSNAGRCTVIKSGTMQPADAQGRSRVCLDAVSFEGDCPAEIIGHVLSLRRELDGGPRCEMQVAAVVELSKESRFLTLSEKGGDGLFCEKGDTQIDFFRPAE